MSAGGNMDALRDAVTKMVNSGKLTPGNKTKTKLKTKKKC